MMKIYSGLTVLIVAMVTALAVHEHNETSRKERILRGPASAAHYEKANGLFRIQLASKASSPAGQFQVEANITALNEVSDAQYTWNLPNDVQALSRTDGHLGSFLKGETKTITFTALQGSSLNHQLHLHVYRMRNGEARGSLAQFNTVQERALSGKAFVAPHVFNASSTAPAPVRITQ